MRSDSKIIINLINGRPVFVLHKKNFFLAQIILLTKLIKLETKGQLTGISRSVSILLLDQIESLFPSRDFFVF